MNRVLFSLLLGLALCAQALAQPTIVDDNSDAPSLVNTCTVSLDVSGSDTFLYASFVIYEVSTNLDAPPDTVTFNGDSLAVIQNVAGDPVTRNTLTVSTWGLINPDAGTHDLVASWTDTQRDLVCRGVVWSGVHQTTATGTPNSAQADDGPATVDIASATGEVVIATLAAMTNPVTEGAGQTQIGLDEDLPDSAGIGAASYEAGATSVTMSYTLGGSGFDDRWIILGVSIKPAAGGGGGTCIPTMSLLGVSQC